MTEQQYKLVYNYYFRYVHFILIASNCIQVLSKIEHVIKTWDFWIRREQLMASLKSNYSLWITQIKDNLVRLTNIILKCSEMACKIKKYVVFTLSELVKKKIKDPGSRIGLQAED